jgi:alpha-N-acetylglucosaminidase|eukprot:COSAG01_NODE_2269_length_8033_cov_30.452609_2_plen_465_part_00
MLLLRLLLRVGLVSSAAASLSSPPVCDKAQVMAAQALIGRVLGISMSDAGSSFSLSCTDEEEESSSVTPSFKLHASPAGGPIAISGSSGVALASGFHWYLKHSCNVSVLYGHQRIPNQAVPKTWPAQAATVTMHSPVAHQYYMNVCTHSYSAAWWDWPRWQSEIDWMAMMGINLPLAFTGQEFVWDKVYREKFGLTRADMDRHFAGPAFLAWGRMGNIHGWGGMYERVGVTGLTPHWMEAQRQLQKQIVARERSLGMRTVLPAFAGHVPLALPAKYPGTKMGSNPCWGASGFTSKRWSCDGLLDVADPKFMQIAEAFMFAQQEEYGSDGIYNGDTFNEMAASGNISEWGRGVYSAMAKADPKPTWFIQGWSLNGWETDKLNAYFSGVPDGGLLSLELSCATSSTSFLKFTSGLSPPRPVICGLLDNMGGRRSLSGALGKIATQTLANVAKAGTTSVTDVLRPEP